MNTQIVFKIDRKLKESAMRKAHNHGVSLSAVLKEATRSYVEGKIRMALIQTPEIPNTKTKREWDKAFKDIKKGKNLSPFFDNAEEAIAYLKKHAS